MKIIYLTGIGFLSCASLAHAQLRIVQYNSGTAKTGLSTILQQMGNEKVNGLARPIDALVVEEQDSSTDPGGIVNILNGIYGANTYVAGPYTGISSGAGTQVVIYRPSTLTLVNTPFGIGTVSSTTNARQTIKYEFRPAGYTDAADFYLYASHMKADTGASNVARRNAEAISNRADADAMGPNQNIIYAGDFNFYSGTESGFTTLTAPGNGQAVDPAHSPLNWSGSANRIYHTQSPATTSAYGGQVTGGMNDRFDFQLISNNLNDGQGLAIIPGSYRAFGNNGTQPLNGAINDPANTWNPPGLTVPASTVLNALTTASDHIPVVADYQLPAMMSVGVGTVASQVIVGASTTVNVTVTNSAPVNIAIGADKLNYSVTSSGSLTGSANGVATATLAGNLYALALNTSTPGNKSGAVNIAATSQEVPNPNFSQNVTTTVLAHSTPSFSSVSTSTSLTLDFGIIARGLTSPTKNFSISNLADASGFTAGLDLDSIIASGDTSKLTTNAATFTNLSAGATKTFAASLNTTSNGSFSATYTLAASDQDLPGAASRGSLTLNLEGTIALGGDTNLDGKVDITDLGNLAAHFNSTGDWFDGDFNGDGAIDITDLGLLANDWQIDESQSMQSALSFQNALAEAGLAGAAVPEPTAICLLCGLTGLLSVRRRSRSI